MCRIKYVTHDVLYFILSTCVCFVAQRDYSWHVLYPLGMVNSLQWSENM